MNIRIFDIETNSIDGDKVHCLSYYDVASKTFESTSNYKEIRSLFRDDVIWLGHNITRFDIPFLKRVVNIDVPDFLIDTLGLSWYLYPERLKHGLDEWGQDLGIEKPPIKDWENLPVETYIHRCEEDVKINTKLWNKQWKFLNEIYKDEENLIEFLKYIHFKLDCVKEQEEIGLSLDIPHIQKCVSEWTEEKEKRTKELEDAMPKVPIYKVKKYPKAITKKDGSFSKQGELWFDLLKEEGLEVEDVKEVKTIVGYNQPNANSHSQIKAWLEGLGWEPQHIKHVRNKETNEVKLIPQIKSKFEEGELCESVQKLFEKEPKLELLEGLFILQHRIALMEKFLEDQKDGKIYPSMGGLTNTLRLKHKVVVNLPAIYKPYGKEVRSSIIASEGCTLVGADLANIEDRTKRHFIYKYDPEYVETMNTPGYDAHLEIAILAGFMTKEEAEWYKEYEKGNVDKSPENKEKYSKLKGIRNKSKVTNFSATYKVGAEALARNANIPLGESKKLLRIYWNRNKAILDIENDCKIREINGTRWLQNPISNFWYFLRSDKDKFSTLNQGSAVFIFDKWIQEQRALGLKIPFQYHDECLQDIPNEDIEEIQQKVNIAMNRVNEKCPLNVSVGCSLQTGKDYADCH